jgi:hypothetical protein
LPAQRFENGGKVSAPETSFLSHAVNLLDGAFAGLPAKEDEEPTDGQESNPDRI